MFYIYVGTILFINNIIIKYIKTYNLMVLFLNFNNSLVRVACEVGLFSIIFFRSFFLEKYIFVAYSFSLFSKNLFDSPNLALFTI